MTSVAPIPPASLEIVTLDDRVADAARREGFVVRGDPSPVD